MTSETAKHTDETSLEQDRRHSKPQSHILWSKLNDSQKATVSSLSHFGYDLSFIRVCEGQDQVIVSVGDKTAVIDQDGNVDPDPRLKVRRK